MSSSETANRGRHRNGWEHLLCQLLACPNEQRPALLGEKRYQSRRLLDVLLEQGQAALPFDLARGAEIVSAASILAQHFEERGAFEDEFERRRRTYCLAGTVRRLLGDHQGAESFFSKAAFMQVSRPERGPFSRGLALLRWDQGRFDEAGALLGHAARQFSRNRAKHEKSTCLALAGMLANERMTLLEGAEYLEAALPNLDTQRRPCLACGARLSLALSYIERGWLLEARAAREQAWSHQAKVANEKARDGLQWLEGQVAAGLGDTADAESLLDSVRRKFLAARLVPEATMATIDLGLTLAETFRGANVEPLVQEMAQTLAGQPGVDLALTTLSSLVAGVNEGPLHRPLWLYVGSALRLRFRQQGVFFQPVPFT